MITLSPADAEALATRALVACGTSLDNAKSTAHALIAADIDGQSGHGLSRLPGYAAQALKSSRLAGAALDVFETEPLTAAAGAQFKDVPNLLLTPHVAGVTDESNIRVSAVTAKTVLEILESR